MISDARREELSHVPGPIWNDRYESLRAAWTTHTSGWGRDLFLRRGSVAWMKAWSVAGAIAEPAKKMVNPAELTSELEREVTGELVNIILHQ